jgi:hypothetical protein
MDDVVKLAAITAVQSSMSYHYEPTVSNYKVQGHEHEHKLKDYHSPKPLDNREEALNNLPSNIRKIIDEHRNKKKEDSKE